MGSVIKLFNPAKSFPMALLTSVAFFFSMYFLNAKALSGTTEIVIAIVASVIGFILFLLAYVVMDKAMATELLADLYDDEEQIKSLGELFGEAKNHFPTFFGIVLTFLILYNLIIPTIGNLAGGIFQVSIMDFEFNILTLVITMTCIAWVFLGAAQSVFLEASFFETIKFTFGFVFNNFLKTILFFVVIVILHLLLNLTFISTMGLSMVVGMAIKIFVFAYLFAFCNAYAIYFFVNNVMEEDFNENGEDDEEYEDYD